MINSSSREWLNPDVRLALPADFPPALNVNYVFYLQEALREALARRGDSLENVKRLTIAFPRKDPTLFSKHRDGAAVVAERLAQTLKSAVGTRVEIQRADGICEMEHLDRSSNQSVLHALTGRQVYRYLSAVQTGPLALAEKLKDDGPHYVVIADGQIEQGTTIANLASYIHHNGGDVLMAVCQRGSGVLVPQRFKDAPKLIDGPALSERFAAAVAGDNLKIIGDTLADAAKAEGVMRDRLSALDEVEDNLNGHGFSLSAMTHVEMRRLYDATRLKTLTYKAVAGRR